jgi:hypothetical protein
MNAQVSDRESLRFLAHAYYFSSALFALVRLGLADALADGRKSASELAAAAATDPDRTARLLRLLAAVGICVEDEAQRFSLTASGQYLRSDHAQSMSKEILMFCGGEAFAAWNNTVDAVKSGTPAFDLTFGKPLFAYLAEHPASAERFHKSWEEITTQAAREAAERYDFSATTLTDVGGGYGIFLGTLMQQRKGLRGVLFDLPFSVAGAAANFARLGVSERVSVITGDATEHVPAMEMCLMKSVIHVCDDERARRILTNCAAALPAVGKVLVCERVLPEANRFHWSRLVDMTMAIMTGGRERTLGEYEALFVRSGLRLSGCVELPCGFSLVEGTKA